MENIHRPEYTGATEVLDFTRYFQEYQSAVRLSPSSAEEPYPQYARLLEEEFELNLSEEDIKELENLCTVNKLTVPNENLALPLAEIPNKSILIETHPVTAEAKKLQLVKAMEEYDRFMNEVIIPVIPAAVTKVGNIQNDDYKPDIKPGSAFTCTLTVYRPINTFLNIRWSNHRVRPQQDIEVLNSTTLTQIADKIKCVSDKYVTTEVENLLEDFSKDNPKELYPSRCFFIENVFYNDLSHPNAIDYSEVVRKWASEKKINGLRSELMEGVTVGSLKFRLGYGYVYIHQGNCEHIVSFTDARLVQPSDCLTSGSYPHISYIKRLSFFHCFLCNVNSAAWVVVGSDRLPSRRTFFCTKCCQSYMFIDGRKIGSFQLYPYRVGAAYSDEENDDGDEDL